MKLRHWFLTSGSLILILHLLLGCAHQKPQTAKTPNTVQSYSNDGLFGLSDANPNLPSNPSYHTYAVDQRMVLSVLRKVKGIRKVNIVSNGPNLYVYLKLAKNMNQAAAAEVQKVAFRAVSLNMPRYRVNVIVGNTNLHNHG